MKTTLLLAAVAAMLLLAALVSAAPAAPHAIAAPAVSATAAPGLPSDPAETAWMLLGLLGLAGLALAGSRPGERAPRLAPRRALVAALAVLLPGSAGATPILSEVLFNPTGTDDALEWIEIYNDGASSVDLSGYSLGWGGVDYTTGTAQLSGILLPGDYFVVGGPTSNAANGDPVFDLVLNFTPDLENSGWFQAADGVALFDTLAALITPTTVPIDAFIYRGPIGGTNSNGLMDESGSPGAIDFTQPFFASGYTAEFDGTTWSTQNSPSPNTGPLTMPEPSTGLLLMLGIACLGLRRGRRAG